MTNFLIRLFIKDKDNVKDPAVRNKYAMLLNITGIVANIFLSLAKFILGTISASVALIADAFNNISDAVSNIVSIFGFYLSSKHADKKHPHGHGRLEYITALIVDIMIVIVGIELFFVSIDKIKHPQMPNLNTLMLFVLLLAILIKLWMFFFYRKIGEKINSSAVRATSLDTLCDIVATAVVFLSAIIAKFSGIILDGWAGIMVAAFITFTGIKAGKETVELLLGSSPAPELVEKIEEFVINYPDVLGIHDLMVHEYGPTRLIVTLHLEISEEIGLRDAHEIADKIEKEIEKKFGCITTIHLDPIVVNNEYADNLKSLALSCAQEIDPSFTIHDFRITGGEDNITMIFDLSIPTNTTLKDEEAARLVKELILQKNPACHAIIKAEHPFV